MHKYMYYTHRTQLSYIYIYILYTVYIYTIYIYIIYVCCYTYPFATGANHVATFQVKIYHCALKNLYCMKACMVENLAESGQCDWADNQLYLGRLWMSHHLMSAAEVASAADGFHSAHLFS